jgi:hypothetical protein
MAARKENSDGAELIPTTNILIPPFSLAELN